MPRGIAGRQIGITSIAGTPIATRGSAPLPQAPYQYPPGSYTWTCPYSGFWKFICWGPGGVATGQTNGAGSGAYVEKTVYVSNMQTVSITVGGHVSPAATTVTLPDGTVLSAGAGSSVGTGGTASGGDVNLNGSAGGSAAGTAGTAGSGTGGGSAGTGNGINSGGGGGAPGNLPYRGGAGGNAGSEPGAAGFSPGGGGGSPGSGHVIGGGDGLAIIAFARP